MNRQAEAPVWHAPGADVLLREAWDEAVAVYHRLTGETHLLSLLPAELLNLLEAHPMTLDALTEELARRCEVPADDAFRQKIESLLRELAALSLVQADRQ